VYFNISNKFVYILKSTDLRLASAIYWSSFSSVGDDQRSWSQCPEIAIFQTYRRVVVACASQKCNFCDLSNVEISRDCGYFRSLWGINNAAQRNALNNCLLRKQYVLCIGLRRFRAIAHIISSRDFTISYITTNPARTLRRWRWLISGSVNKALGHLRSWLFVHDDQTINSTLSTLSP